MSSFMPSNSSPESMMTPEQLGHDEDLFFVAHENGCPLWDSKFELGEYSSSIFFFIIYIYFFKNLYIQ